MTIPEPEGSAPVTHAAATPEPLAAPRRLRRVHLAVSAISLLAGAAVAVAVLLATGWREVPVHRYQVRVFFEDGATAAQKEAARSGLDRLPSDESARLLTREEAFALAEKTYADKGDPLPDTVTAESMTEMAEISTRGRDFDCATVAGLKEGPGIGSIGVVEFRDENVAVAGIRC